MLELSYSAGTIIVRGDHDFDLSLLSFLTYDPRIDSYRCYACKYEELIKYLNERKISYVDNVLKPIEGNIIQKKDLSLKEYQEEALEAWLLNNKKGIVVLPTGTGKTFVGLAAISNVRAPTLIVVPTLELMEQWYWRVKEFFDVSIGRFGGGYKEIEYITIITYDSAYINAEYIGNKFELMIFDEVHHLPSEGFRQIALLSASPYRLGLTATPEREDGLHELLPSLVGDIVYRRSVVEMKGKYLAPFEIVRYYVDLSEEERKKYEELRKKFKKFFDEHGIKLDSLEDFYQMILKSGKDRKAREALIAWNEARKLALNASNKLNALEKILEKHKGERIIIFTEYNSFARLISKKYLIPEITYRTPEKERIITMERFRKGIYNVLVTSKVLEEGIDVPSANVGIILSGSGSKREFIQRLGRILRPMKDKNAILYEIVTRNTSEVNVSYRRRRELLSEFFD
ncbi:MAG: DEAD/DEAH box helicase family protein [Thermoproteota archaeon]|jgi:superfamily II DNA or RNA helicase|nr:DEAD/DEAH box helicase family protein [Thermoproteota archaeon]